MLVLSLLPEHMANGHTVAVAALSPSEIDFLDRIDSSKEKGVNWFTPDKSLKGIARIFLIRKIIDQFMPDILISHSVIPSFYARLACMFSSNPKIMTVLHSSDDFKDRKIRLSENILKGRADAVIAVSEEIAERYRSRFAHKNVSAIRNGIRLSRGFRLAKRFDSLVGNVLFNENSRIVIQIGRVIPLKQQHLSILAFNDHINKQNDRDSLLVFAGIIEDSEYHMKLRNMIDALALTGRVHFIGGRDDVPELLRSSNLFLMPSLREAHSIALIEALDSGIQIVASDLSAFAHAKGMEGIEFVDPEDTSKFGQKISQYLQDNRKYARDLSLYSISNTALEYENVANSLLDKL